MNFDAAYALSTVGEIASKLPLTLMMALIATILSLLMGIIFAVIIRCDVPILKPITKVLMSFFKSVPVLVLLYVAYYAMPSLMTVLSEKYGFAYDVRNPPSLSFAIIAFAVTYSSYMCDMIIAALDTIVKGQFEACYAMGFTKFQMMTRIIMPQLIVVAIPNFGNHFINLVKATSLAYMVGVIEIMGMARNIGSTSLKFLEPYVVAALIYWIVCFLGEKLVAFIEKRLGKYRRGITE